MAEKSTNAKRAWWTLDEVRETVFHNALSKQTISNLIREREIPSKKFGIRRIFIPNGWVQEQLKESEKVTLDA